MKAITVKYIPQTSIKPSRLKAYDMDGNNIILSYDCARSEEDSIMGDECYQKAAEALRDKMGWEGRLVGGAQKPGVEVFVFVSQPVTLTISPDCG